MRKITLSAVLLGCAVMAYGQQLDTASYYEMQEIDVVALRVKDNTPTAYSEISKTSIDRMNYGQDMPYLMTTLPSVVATSDAGTGVGYTGIHIRGVDPTRINITANGVPLNDVESHQLYWVDVPDFATSVEDIQVQRGVGTSTNGSGAFGGSINLRTEPLSTKANGEIQLGYGSFNTRRVTAKFGTGLFAKHWNVSGRVSKLDSDGYIRRATSDLFSYMLQAGYYNRGTSIKFITFGGLEETYHAWNGVDESMMDIDRRYNSCGEIKDDAGNVIGFYDNQIDWYRQSHYHLVFSQRLSDKWNASATLHYTRGDGYYEEYKNGCSLVKYNITPFMDGGALVEYSNLVRRKEMGNDFGGGVFSLNYEGDKLDFTLGGAANKYDGDHYGRVMSVENHVFTVPDGQEYYRNKGIKKDANIYAKANYRLTSKINFYADLQYRHIDYSIDGENDKWDSRISAPQVLAVDEKYDFFNPKAGIFVQLTNKSDLYASVAVAHKEPTRNNFTDAMSDKAPLAERLIDYELGYEYKSEAVTAGVNLYYMDYKNQLVLTGKLNEIGEALSENMPDSYRAGIELTAGWNITKNLKWSANATFSRNIIKDYVDYVSASDDYGDLPQVADKRGNTQISFSPSVLVGSLVEYSNGNFYAAFQSNYVGKQYIDNSEHDDLMLDAYFVNNLRANYSFPLTSLKVTAIVGIAVNNIFNEMYSSNGWGGSYYYNGVRGSYMGYFPQAGCNFMANLTIKF